MSWTDWTSGDWLGKWVPQWNAPSVRLPEAIVDGMSRLADVFGFSPAAFLQNTVAAASAGLVDRELQTTIGGESVQFVLDALQVDPPPYGPLVGQYGEVGVRLSEVSWRDRRLARVVLRACNVHLQPGVPTTLVAAPVKLTATIDQSEIASLVAENRAGVVIRLADGVATASMLGREHWGHVEIAPVLRGESVRLEPVAIEVRGRRLKAVALLIPHVDLRLPPVPQNGRFTDVVVEEDRLRVEAVVEEWREPLQPKQLQDLDRRLRNPGKGLFRLPRS